MFGILANLRDVLYPTQASTMSSEIDWLAMFINWVCIVSGAIIFIGTIYIGVKFRYRPGHPEKGSGSSHSTFLEIFWSVIPAIICLMIAIWGMQGYLKFNVSPPVADIEVQVDAQKWSWDFTYINPSVNGFHEPVLHLYKGASVRFVLSSNDVIHSLYFPQFRIKKDCVPGRYNKMWVVPTEVSTVLDGSPLTEDNNYAAWTNPDNFKFDFNDVSKKQDGFDIYCAEYCGTKHSKMLTKVYVHPTKENFLQWLANAADIWRPIVVEGDPTPRPPSVIGIGEKLYKGNGCAGCHSVDGSKGTGPSWKDMFGRTENFTDGTSASVDENYIKESIEYPTKKIVAGFSPAMSSYLGKFKPEEYKALIAYMKSISTNYKGTTADLEVPPPEVADRYKKKQ